MKPFSFESWTNSNQMAWLMAIEALAALTSSSGRVFTFFGDFLRSLIVLELRGAGAEKKKRFYALK